MRRYYQALTEHRAYLNSLNVYPVPDGDTGTNMALTLKSVVDALGDPEEAGFAESLESVCRTIGESSLMGARGNSGVILSQILRSLCTELADVESVDAKRLAAALNSSAKAAYGAVLRPVEGTILTVVRHLAAAAEEAASASDDLPGMLERSLEAGRKSLERTPDLLEVLRLAGVVDAGGAGLLLLIEALLCVADGRGLSKAPEVGGIVMALEPPGAVAHDESSVADLRYEVMFLLSSDDEHVARFQERWQEVGDSIVVVGGDGLWNCHIHTDDIGAAIEAGIEAGRPRRIEVTDLHEQVAHTEHVAPPQRKTSGVVAVAAGDGVRGLFEALGAEEVVTGGQTMNPPTLALKEAAERLAADEVLVLPNNKNVIAAAKQVGELTDKKIVVVPTSSVPEGLSAMLAFDADSGAEENGEVMLSMAADVVHGEVTRAVRSARTPMGDVAEGDFMGISAGEVRVVRQSLVEATCGLLAELVSPDHELVTLVAGADAGDDETEEVRSWLEGNRPDVELDLHVGGQPLYHYYIGVE